MLQDLTYRVVMIDDDPDFYLDYMEEIKELLDKSGYLLEHQRYEKLEQLDDSLLDDVDLFLVDLKFGDEDKGPEFIAKIREKYSTDILFYSSHKDAIEESRSKGEYEGVFFAVRDDNTKEIENKIEQLIEKMIKHSNTPLASRGIVLGSVAEIDNLIKKKISELLNKMDSDQVDELMDECTKHYHSSFNNRCNKYKDFFGTEFHNGKRKRGDVIENYEKYNILELIDNISITDSNKNLHVLLKSYKTLYKKKDDTYKAIENFKNLLADRNTLAHVCETRNEKGEYQFKRAQKGGNLVLTERKSRELRKTIIRYYKIINSISV